MNKLLTAKEAAKISEKINTIDDTLKDILDMVLIKAEHGERMLSVHGYGFCSIVPIEHERYYPLQCKLVMEKLRELGYSVQIKELLRETYLIINW